MRWLRIGAVVALLGLSMTMVAPAQALQGPPPKPLAFPGSTLKASAPDMTPREWNRFLKNHPELRPTPTTPSPKLGFKGRGAGSALVALAGLDVGLQVGTYSASLMGLPTSGDFWCDLATLVASSTCGMTAGPEYVPNGDLGIVPGDGWIGFVQQHGEPEFRAVGGTVAFPPSLDAPVAGVIEVNATITVPQGWTVSGGTGYSARRLCRLPNGGVGPIAPTIGFSWPGPLSGGTWTVTTPGVGAPWAGGCGNLGSGAVFEGVVVYRGTAVPTAATLPTMVAGGSATTWHVEGSPDRPDNDPNPETWWRTTWQCDAAAPHSVNSATFREADEFWPPMPQASCDPGAVVTSVLMEQLTAAGVRAVILDWTLDQPGIDWNTQYPQCADGSCILDLLRIDPETQRRLSCFSNPALCWDWFSDPNKLDKFECQYAGTVVALKECNVYKPTFPGPGLDWDYADPDPEDPDPPVGPPIGVPPGENPLPLPPDLTPVDESCPPDFTWLSLFNPWWYYKSVTCALTEAFVPTDIEGIFAGVVASWEGTSVAQWSAAAGGVFDSVSPVAGTCRGPGFTWALVGVEVYPFDACTEATANMALWSRRIATAGLIVFGGMACVRALGSGFGWKPSAGGDS